MRNIVVLPRLRQSPGDLPITRRESKWTQRIVVCSLLVIVVAYIERKEEQAQQFVRDRFCLFVVRCERKGIPYESR